MDIHNKSMRDPVVNLSFSQLCEHFTFLERELLTLLSVDRRTLNTWLRHDKAPMIARRLVAIVGRGYLPSEPDWEGFSIRNGEIRAPTGQHFTPGQINGWFYKEQMIESYRCEAVKIRRENERLKRHLLSSNESIFKEDGELRQLVLL